MRLPVRPDPEEQHVTMHAVFNGAVVAESDRTLVVEGNHYFPEDSVRHELLARTRALTICPWKGRATYYDVTVDGATSRNAAWQYRHPLPLARKVRGRFAFWGAVVVQATTGTHGEAAR